MSHFIKVVLFLLILSLSSLAGSINYTPTEFTGSKQEVRDHFSRLWKKFKNYDNYHCYRRAHVLVNQMVHLGVNPVKIFFFRGNKRVLPLNWYYHVAPATYHNGELVVLDRGLFDGATHVEDWLDALSRKNGCQQYDSYAQFKQDKHRVACGYVISSMYNYGPNDIDQTRNGFVKAELIDSLLSMSKAKRRKYQSIYPLASE